MSRTAHRVRMGAAGVSLPVTPPATGPESMLMGVSLSDEDHGGIPDWDAIRAYTYSAGLSTANAANRPKVIALTDGGGVYTGYTATFDNFVGRLEDFYYGAGSANRKNVALHIGNGNEYGDKVGEAGTPTVAAFVEGCRGMYDATRVLNGDGTRRYPLASVWLDPTNFQEQSGIVQRSLHPAARWLDGVAWSMYPPGRENTSADPTFSNPSLDPADRANTVHTNNGFLVRCFYRTQQAVLQARLDRGDPGFKLAIACWEVGIGDDPDDSTHRPYYAAHSLAGTMYQLSLDFADEISSMPVALWWDQQVTTLTFGDSGDPFPRQGTNSQNILSDEPLSTNPSTAEAWKHWPQYNHSFGGTHPAGWPAAPRASWPTGA